MEINNFVNPEVNEKTLSFKDTFSSAQPFRHVIIDDFFTEDFCQQLLAEFPAFDEKLAINEDGVVGAKAVHEKIVSIGKAYKQLDGLCQSQPFLDLVGNITSIANLQHDPWYFGGGTHENREGQSLDAHVDFNYHPKTRQHRRLNLIVYLNREWEDSWGGSLQLHRDPSVSPSEDDIKVVTPLFNRCVIFETNEHSWHGFRRIGLPEDKKDLSRKSFALYYYTDERPEEEVEAEHSTIYVEQHLPETYESGMTLTGEQLQHVKNLLASRDQHLKRLYGHIKDLNSQLTDARSAISGMRAVEEAAESKKVESVEEARAQMDRLTGKLSMAQARVDELEQSTSWKITAPIRAIKKLFLV